MSTATLPKSWSTVGGRHGGRANSLPWADTSFIGHVVCLQAVYNHFLMASLGLVGETKRTTASLGNFVFTHTQFEMQRIAHELSQMAQLTGELQEAAKPSCCWGCSTIGRIQLKSSGTLGPSVDMFASRENMPFGKPLCSLSAEMHRRRMWEWGPISGFRLVKREAKRGKHAQF